MNVSRRKRTVPIARPSLGEEEWLAMREPILSGWVTQGPKVAEFETAFAARHEVSHALATTSCTTGLHLALAAAGIGPGDEVIVPSFTWVATANAVLYCGATPVLCDVDVETYNIDPASAATRVTDRTKAVIAVHLFGLCADMEGLRASLPPDVLIFEDAACAAGARYRGLPAGGLGQAAAFSFHPRKSITTGEGGMLTTNDAALAERANAMRNHGASVSEEVRHRGPQPYLLPDFNELGFNYRMTDMQAAMGLVQLNKLNGFVAERQRYAEFYRTELTALDWLQLPRIPEDGQHAWQAYVVRINPTCAPMPRNELMRRLHAEGVATRPGTHAIHMLGYHARRFGLEPDDLPGSRDCQENAMAMPLHNQMEADDYDYVIETLKRIARHA